jgi:hypothetical protein
MLNGFSSFFHNSSKAAGVREGFRASKRETPDDFLIMEFYLADNRFIFKKENQFHEIMKTLISNRAFSILAFFSLVALGSCSTARDSQTRYIDLASPNAYDQIMSLRIDQNFQLTEDHPYVAPSQSQYIDIWRHGHIETIYASGVNDVVNLGNKSMIVLQNGEQIITHNNNW